MHIDDLCKLNDEQILSELEKFTYRDYQFCFFDLSLSDKRLLRIIRLIYPTFQASETIELNKFIQQVCPASRVNNDPFNWKFLCIIFATNKLFLPLCSDEYNLLGQTIAFLQKNPDTPFKFHFLGKVFSVVDPEIVADNLMNTFYPEGVETWKFLINSKNLQPDRFQAFYSLKEQFPNLDNRRFENLCIEDLESPWKKDDPHYISMRSVQSGMMIRKGKYICVITRPNGEPLLIIYEANHPFRQVYSLNLLEAFDLPRNPHPENGSLGIYPTQDALALTAKESNYVLFVDEQTGQILKRVQSPIPASYNTYTYVSPKQKIFVFDHNKGFLYTDSGTKYQGNHFDHGDGWCVLRKTTGFWEYETTIFTDQGIKTGIPYSILDISDNKVYGFDDLRGGIYVTSLDESSNEQLLYETDACSSIHACNGYVIFEQRNNFYTLKSGVVKRIISSGPYSLYHSYLNREERNFYLTGILDKSFYVVRLNETCEVKKIETRTSIPDRSALAYADKEVVYFFSTPY